MRKSAPLFCALLLSLSARRAWIEINMSCSAGKRLAVALRKESVDRNLPKSIEKRDRAVSLSARRAWIEILYYGDDLTFSDGRSPQGERG